MTKPADKPTARRELNVKSIFLRRVAVLSLPRIGTALIFSQLNSLPPSLAKKFQLDVETGGIASAHNGNEPLIPRAACLCDDFAGLAAFQDAGFVPHRWNRTDHVASRIIQIALGMSAETEEGRCKENCLSKLVTPCVAVSLTRNHRTDCRRRWVRRNGERQGGELPIAWHDEVKGD